MSTSDFLKLLPIFSLPASFRCSPLVFKSLIPMFSCSINCQPFCLQNFSSLLLTSLTDSFRYSLSFLVTSSDRITVESVPFFDLSGEVHNVISNGCRIGGLKVLSSYMQNNLLWGFLNSRFYMMLHIRCCGPRKGFNHNPVFSLLIEFPALNSLDHGVTNYNSYRQWSRFF